MADNTTLPTGAGGDTIRTIDRTTSKTQVVALDFGGEAGPESLLTGFNALPVSDIQQAAQIAPLLQAILTELRVTNFYLQVGLNVKDDPDTLRADPTFNS